MPTTRRGVVKSRKRGLENKNTSEESKRFRSKAQKMEQSVETNGCADGPTSVAVSNHSDSSQNIKMTERPVIKPATPSALQESKSTRHASSSSRLQKHSANVSSHVTKKLSSQRRTTRHSPPVVTSVNDKRPAKNSITTSPTQQSNKRASTSHHISQTCSQNGSSTVFSTVNVTAQENNSLVKSNKHLSQSSPSINRKRAKRTVISEPDNSMPRSSKRIRLQYQPFQSPSPPTTIPSMLRHSPKTPEDKIVVFNKGEFLAVRNENGTFFVCRTAQNVYKSSRRFKIQWLNNDDKHIYTPDFYDYTDFECVLTNLRMKRTDKNKYHLPNDEMKRTMNILQRALNVENGMDIPDLHKVTMDGVDVSIVGKIEEETLLQQQKQEQQQQQELQSDQSSKVEQGNQSSRFRGRGRPKKSDFNKTNVRCVTTESKKQKRSISKVKLQSRELAKVKLRTKKGVKQKEPGEKAVILPEPRRKTRKSEKLVPNPSVKVFEKDPTFESSLPIPFISTLAQSKLLIRAVLMKDFNLLTSLMGNEEEICSLNIPRSVDVPLTALQYAVIKEDHRITRALLSAKVKKYAAVPANLLQHMGTGRYNPVMLGHAIRSISIGRGAREGNNAFLKDSHIYSVCYPSVTDDLIDLALRSGVSLETLKLFKSENDTILRRIAVAVRHGHRKLAGHLVKEAVENGGYGYSTLHQMVLLNDKQELPKLRAVSVIKKSLYSPRITPLHCSAINPNTQYLATLLDVGGSYNLPDKDGWQPIHYAAVCKSTAPLELLLSRGVMHEDVMDSEGNTPLHVACIAGRAQNVELLILHSPSGDKKDQENGLSLSSEKFGIAGIDRPNKKTFCPLHIAAQHGYTNVIKILLRHGANTEKPTSAAHEKLTPLMLASQWGHLDVVKQLVESGTQIEATDKRQRTALAHAIINGHAHVASYLLWLGSNPNSKDSSGNTLVHYAASYGWYFCLKLLLEAGADPNPCNDWKITPLSLAFLKGHMGLIDYLLEQPGASLDVVVDTDKGITLLMQTVRSEIGPSMLERLKFLVVKQKADCTVVDFCGNNVLHHFVLSEGEALKKFKDDEIMKEENIRNSEFAEAKCSEQLTETRKEEKAYELFKEEIKQEHDKIVKEIVQLFLSHGCDPKTINKESESPFTLAVREGCLLLVEVFMNAGCELTLDVSASPKTTILHSMVEYVLDKEVKPLIDLITKNASSADNSARNVLSQMSKVYDKDGFTPLLLAVNALQPLVRLGDEQMERMFRLIEFLVNDLKSNVQAAIKNNGKEGDMCTVLHLATKSLSSRIFDILLPHNPTLDALNSEKETPLIFAIKIRNIDAAEKIIRAGCDVNIRSEKDDNVSPLILAARDEKFGSVVQLLLQHKADPNDIDPTNGFTALHYIVTYRCSDVVETAKALVNAGASVNACNKEKQTPLHLAVNSHMDGADAFYAVEDFLLNTSGAKTDTCDSYGRIPLHYAFVDMNYPNNKQQIDPIELVSLLTNSMGSNSIEIMDNHGRTPLHRAAYRGATISCMHLSSKMKSIDVKDKDGNTPLGLALLNSHESCALMLLQKGCSCTTDLVQFSSESRKTKDEDSVRYWIWHHVREKISPPLKYSVFQEAVQKDMQGIVFLMLDQLEAGGKGYSIAIEAAIKAGKYNLALKLIPRVKHSWTLYNEKQSTLHILARQPKSELQVKVAQALIDKGVPLMAKDEHNCSVIIYCALKWNSSLLSFICDKVGTLASIQADPDKSLRTPLSALFWQLTEKDFTREIKKCFLNMIKEGANPNVLTRYPIRESSYTGVRCIVSDTLHEESNHVPSLSPLIVAIYQQNFEVVKLLLKHGADVNFCDSLQRTPLMIAAKLNDIKMAKLLLNHSYNPYKDKHPYSESSKKHLKKTSQANLSLKDSMGRTVVHHVISPFQEFSYENVALLELLAHVGAPLDVIDKDGNSPLQLALRNKAENAVEMLQKLLKVPAEKWEKLQIKFPSPGGIVLDLGISQWNYKQDAACMLRDLKKDKAEQSQTCQPDRYSDMTEIGEIVIDTDKDVPYDILMTNVDLRYGSYGLYNFYKMQLIHQKNKDLFLLFTRWGRIGDSGQYQKTPFLVLEEAVKEFCKIFRSKSGNSWDNVKNFQSQPKKYSLVSLEKRLCVQKNDLIVEITNKVPSKLPTCLEKLLNKLMDVHMLKKSLSNMGCEGSPFGALSEKSLREAEEILNSLREVVTEKENLEHNLKTQDHYSELAEKILDLSEKFYRLVPLYGYSYEGMKLLATQDDIDQQLQVIHDLIHIELAGELLLGAHYRSKEINAADYIYKCLGCQLDLLDENSMEAQLILQYIHNTKHANNTALHVEAIFRVIREGEYTNTKELHHHMMLWHGTKMSNLLGILKRGLQVSPLGVEHCGAAFGKGIYLADMFQKSELYCYNYIRDGTNYILLCEVALGDIKEIDDKTVTNIPKDTDCIKALGALQPSPPHSISWQGCVWPIGPSVDIWDDQQNKFYSNFLCFNEYIVSRPSQVCIRYLVKFTQ